MLWVEVPPGYHWLEPSHPTERLAPFLAHCEDGRLVNANPPWGFYELKPGDQPDPAALAVGAGKASNKPKSQKKVAQDQEKIAKELGKDKRPKLKLFR